MHSLYCSWHDLFNSAVCSNFSLAWTIDSLVTEVFLAARPVIFLISVSMFEPVCRSVPPIVARPPKSAKLGRKTTPARRTAGLEFISPTVERDTVDCCAPERFAVPRDEFVFTRDTVEREFVAVLRDAVERFTFVRDVVRATVSEAPDVSPDKALGIARDATAPFAENTGPTNNAINKNNGLAAIITCTNYITNRPNKKETYYQKEKKNPAMAG